MLANSGWFKTTLTLKIPDAERMTVKEAREWLLRSITALMGPSGFKVIPDWGRGVNPVAVITVGSLILYFKPLGEWKDGPASWSIDGPVGTIDTWGSPKTHGRTLAADAVNALRVLNELKAWSELAIVRAVVTASTRDGRRRGGRK